MIQAALEPYVRPREEAEHIRRVLTLNLRSCYENGPQHGPLALVEADCTLKTTDVRGLQRDYLKALHVNIKAQREYEAVSQRQPEKESKSANSNSRNGTSRLEGHLTAIKLRRRQQALQTVERYLENLGQKPAASSEFLRPQKIFRGTARLPEVPKTVVSGFTVDKDSTKTNLKALVDRLEKAVLRSKLLLKKEEQLLEEVKSRSTTSLSKISDGAKLAALNATRNELISWMETELGKASPVEESQTEEEEGNARSEAKVDKATMDEQRALIKDKYVRYISARRNLIGLVSQSPSPSIEPPEEVKFNAQAKDLLPAPSTHLITPYIETFLAVTHEQKASMAQKSHLNGILARQAEEIGRALDRLAEESQLLPDHPTRKWQERIQGDLPDKGGHEITNRVKPWVSAADGAKLATLEAVAEKIEEGQVALERSTNSLAEIDQLLGRGIVAEDESIEGDTTVDDIWLAETQTPRKRTKPFARSNTVQERKDVWSLLDGSLGLLKADDSPRK